MIIKKKVEFSKIYYAMIYIWIYHTVVFVFIIITVFFMVNNMLGIKCVNVYLYSVHRSGTLKL